MSRNVEAFNTNVHSASRPGTNARTILAEFRLKRFHLSVSFDHCEDRFEFMRSEHGRLVENRTARDNERDLLDKFGHASLAIIQDELKQRRFAKGRGVDQHWLPSGENPPHIRSFDRSKVPKRAMFNGMRPFDPTKD